jgi:hypothetical protein
LPEAVVKLSISGVDGDHVRGAVLKKAIGEAASGGTDVETRETSDVDVPIIESLLQFEPASADVLEIVAQKAEFRVRMDRSSRLHDLLIVHENFAGEDECLCAFPRGRETTIHQQLIEA